MRTIHAADLFCGAGGTSTGLALACRKAGYDVDLLAVNHWNIAVQSHYANHPWARHMCASVEQVDPRKEIPGGRLDILVASPECTQHSGARGGRPVNDQLRASAWHILRWCELIRIDNILIENVREFRDWGPLGANGKPLKSRRGETYQAFIGALRAMGYTVEDRILNAANYGDATTRQRLFIIARKGRRPIVWPEPTHSPDRWRAAREIIDWSLEGESIFTKKKPLRLSTLRRIAAGFRKFGGPDLEPFLVMFYGTNDARSIDRPLPTITANGQHIGICKPFILQQQSGGAPRSTDEPLPTIATKGAQSLIEPYLVPFFGEREGQAPRTHSIDKPLPAVTSHGAGGLVQPYLVPLNHGEKDSRSYSVEKPLPTITGFDALGIIQPYLVKYFGTGIAKSISKPLDTITTKDRFGLVMPQIELKGEKYVIDFRFRMLQPHELAAAMSFDKSYKLSGSRSAQVKQIGNAVPVGIARALCGALLPEAKSSKKAV